MKCIQDVTLFGFGMVWAGIVIGVLLVPTIRWACDVCDRILARKVR